MSPVITDPLATLVQARIDDLRREAVADQQARQARSRASARPRAAAWPTSVARALRETFGRAPAGRAPCCA